MASNAYGWAQPTKTKGTGKGGGGGGLEDMMSTDMGLARQASGQNQYAPDVAPWQMPQNQSNALLNEWMGNQGGDMSWWRDGKNQAAGQSYAQNYGIPLLNAQQADRTQQFNEYNTGRNFDEQARLNSSQMDIANRGSNREDLALRYGQENNVRDFGEASRQFNEQSRIDEMYKTGQLNAQQYANETARVQVDNQNRQASMTDATNRYGMDQQQQLGMTNAANTRYGMTNEYNLGQQQNQNTSIRNANDFSVANQANATNRYGLDLSNQQQMRADSTNRYGMDQQFQLGQGQNANTRYGMDLSNQQAQATNQTNRYGLDLQNQQGIRTDSTNRYGMDLSNQQAQATNATNRYGMDQQYNLGNQQNQNTRYGMDLTNQQAQATNATNRFGIQSQYDLGMGQNANQAYANQAQAQRYQGQTQNEAGANQNSLLNIQNQYALGQGGLTFQNRELDTNEAYRRQQLSQEADLTREKFKNDLTQSRYSAFGRAAAPNARALRSWY